MKGKAVQQASEAIAPNAVTSEGQPVGEKITGPEKVKRLAKPKPEPKQLSCFGHRMGTISGEIDQALQSGGFNFAEFCDTEYRFHPEMYRLGKNVRGLDTVTAKIKAHLAYLPAARGVYTKIENGFVSLSTEAEVKAIKTAQAQAKIFAQVARDKVKAEKAQAQAAKRAKVETPVADAAPVVLPNNAENHQLAVNAA